MIPDMCSVAILVGAIRCARNKVLAIDNARAIRLIRRNPPIEITNGGDAAINDRYSDARAIQISPLPRDGCIDLFLRRSRESKYRWADDWARCKQHRDHRAAVMRAQPGR